MSLLTVLWIVLGVGWLSVIFFVWACCVAAKRGDRMTESCTEFEAHWLEKNRP